MRKTVFSVLCVLLTLCFLLTGCGGGANPSSTSDDADGTTTSGQADATTGSGDSSDETTTENTPAGDEDSTTQAQDASGTTTGKNGGGNTKKTTTAAKTTKNGGKSNVTNTGVTVTWPTYEPKGKYSAYIQYRDTLSNTYNKLTSGAKSLNVVYFGGSVTVGYGASNQETKSWRALIGQWLVEKFPNAKVTNINRGVGESGTYLGSYRFERDVIGANPDLVFIEYSINDLYASATYEQAASQFETIVRGIRKKLPKCDIVTVLVTDQGRATGTLHTQAQAHEDISKAYGISSVHVGRALADSYYQNGGSWDKYMIDIVHPNDTGYAFYYGVIEEFMNNCLFDCKHSGGVKDHAIPSVQSDTLHDGNTTVILPSQQLIERSEALGGNGFRFVNEAYGVNNYDCYLKSNSKDTVLVVEFTGTELVMLQSNSGLEKFYVKVDNDEYKLKKLKGTNNLSLNPVIIVSGLSSGKHTVYLKPNNTVGSRCYINIGALYSRDAAKQTTK